jgi:hypothetical protein
MVNPEHSSPGLQAILLTGVAVSLGGCREKGSCSCFSMLSIRQISIRLLLKRTLGSPSPT